MDCKQHREERCDGGVVVYEFDDHDASEERKHGNLKKKAAHGHASRAGARKQCWQERGEVQENDDKKREEARCLVRFALGDECLAHYNFVRAVHKQEEYAAERLCPYRAFCERVQCYHLHVHACGAKNCGGV